MSEETLQQYKSPCSDCLQHCAKLAVVEDKPIMFDYWTDSQEKKCLIGVKDDNEKLF